MQSTIVIGNRILCTMCDSVLDEEDFNPDKYCKETQQGVCRMCESGDDNCGWYVDENYDTFDEVEQ